MSPAPEPPERGGSHAERRPVVDETSAGGLVTTVRAGRRCGALIGRRDRNGMLRWLLPKGHVEPGETLEEAAVREIREETGIDSRVLAPLGTVAYWFTLAGSRIHKTVHHFVLEAVGGALSADDIEVDEVAWVDLADVVDRLSYPDEQGLAARACAMPGLQAEAE